jgi:hypothetical protein
MKGGKRPGAGRKKGSKDKSTLEKEAVLKVFREKVMKSADALYASQLHLARGQTFLYKIEKETITGPKGGKTIRSKPPKLVTAQWEIEAYLQDLVDEENGMSGPKDRDATYYYLTTKEPSNMAVDSLLDRTFGKSVQAVELTGKDGVALFDDATKAKSKKAISEFVGADIG